MLSSCPKERVRSFDSILQIVNCSHCHDRHKIKLNEEIRRNLKDKYGKMRKLRKIMHKKQCDILQKYQKKIMDVQQEFLENSDKIYQEYVLDIQTIAKQGQFDFDLDLENHLIDAASLWPEGKPICGSNNKFKAGENVKL